MTKLFKDCAAESQGDAFEPEVFADHIDLEPGEVVIRLRTDKVGCVVHPDTLDGDPNLYPAALMMWLNSSTSTAARLARGAVAEGFAAEVPTHD